MTDPKKAHRIVNTVRELVELPEFSFVRGDDGFRHEKQDDGKWFMVSGGGRHSEDSIELPATVLYEPEPSKLATIRDRARNAAVVEWRVRVAEGTQGTPKDHAEAIADAVLTVLFPGSSPTAGLTPMEDVR